MISENAKGQIVGFTMIAVMVGILVYGFNFVTSKGNEERLRNAAIHTMYMEAQEYLSTGSAPTPEVLIARYEGFEDTELKCYAVSQLGYYAKNFYGAVLKEEKQNFLRRCISNYKILDVTDMESPRLKPWEKI